MDFTTWLLFSAVALLAIMSPGPAILLAISNSLTHGTRSVYLSALGNEIGIMIVSLSAVLGLGVILQTSTTLFLMIKVIGAAYLIYLGVRQWRSKTNLFDRQNTEAKKARTNKSFFLEGLLIAVTNPKAILFFTALFPQFININAAVLPQFLMMTLTFMALSFLVLVTYGKIAFKAKRWFSTSKRVKWFNRTMGSLFVLIGLGLLQFKPAR
jgi:RhtB (resistance to homoserine/threonine) family protein